MECIYLIVSVIAAIRLRYGDGRNHRMGDPIHLEGWTIGHSQTLEKIACGYSRYLRVFFGSAPDDSRDQCGA